LSLYAGDAAGVVATGQDGWYRPSGIDAKIYTYAGNALGLAANPNGGAQFLGGRSEGGTSFARAQHDHDFSTSSTWTLAYDLAAAFNGTPPSALNLSSFSLQDSTIARSFIAVNNFVDLNNPQAGWKAEYNVFDAAGGALNNQSPGADWTNLLYNHWYRQSTAIDFATNAIVEVSMTDLTTGVTVTANPVGWYMTGGQNPTQPLPTGVRFFTGGAAGNIMGWDNLSIPEPGVLAVLGLSLGLAGRRRR
jgi:hypothetical protein